MGLCGVRVPRTVGDVDFGPDAAWGDEVYNTGASPLV